MSMPQFMFLFTFLVGWTCISLAADCRYKGELDVDCSALNLQRVLRSNVIRLEDILVASKSFFDEDISAPADKKYVSIPRNGKIPGFLVHGGSPFSCMSSVSFTMLHAKNENFGMVSPIYLHGMAFGDYHYLGFDVMLWLKLDEITVLTQMVVGCPGKLDAMYSGVIGDNILYGLDTFYSSQRSTLEMFSVSSSIGISAYRDPQNNQIYVRPQPLPTVNIYKYVQHHPDISVDHTFWNNTMPFHDLYGALMPSQWKDLYDVVSGTQGAELKQVRYPLVFDPKNAVNTLDHWKEITFDRLVHIESKLLFPGQCDDDGCRETFEATHFLEDIPVNDWILDYLEMEAADKSTSKETTDGGIKESFLEYHSTINII